MSKKLTITMSDQQYDALQQAASQAHVSPDALAASALDERFAGQRRVKSDDAQEEPLQEMSSEKRARENLAAYLRDNGYIADPRTLPPRQHLADLPPAGTPEREQFENELFQELGDAFQRSGLSILDLIERR